MPKPFRRLFFASLTASIVVSLLSGCGEKPAATGGGGGKGGRGGGAAPVVVGQAQRKIVPLVIEAIGAVEPIRATAVRSQVTGILQKIAIKEGQDVKEGDLLFEIDPRPFVNALKSAEADLQKAKVQLETARTQVARYRTLTADQMVSKEQFEKISDTARSLESEVLADESRVSTAKLQLEYCSIRAPLAGRTGNMSVHEGDLVRVNDAGGLLVTINQLNPIYVTFGVPQQYLATLARYRATGTLKVTVVPPGIDEKPEEGLLTFMDNTVDSSTGTLKLKGSFPNDSQRLWPGQFATVKVTLASPEALTVPSAAIQTSQAGQYVYVISAEKVAELRPVVVERIYEADAVIGKGLKDGETIVVDGQLRVIPGRPVDIKDPAAAGKAGKGGKGGDGKGKKKEKEAETKPAEKRAAD
ncbi:efflux RND transporter periplasmic adaptor subunit [Horticoccus sp. 23ND18S-11]|uniref:efflux RND transporter periplasmic adaptor subunit n=1 Tax=Horticoccus sp. 23ND18S-11 TaxID=3391832 RepID=UPI0039C8E7EA